MQIANYYLVVLCNRVGHRSVGRAGQHYHQSRARGDSKFREHASLYGLGTKFNFIPLPGENLHSYTTMILQPQ
jgi:hypothetical protein